MAFWVPWTFGWQFCIFSLKSFRFLFFTLVVLKAFLQFDLLWMYHTSIRNILSSSLTCALRYVIRHLFLYNDSVWFYVKKLYKMSFVMVISSWLGYFSASSNMKFDVAVVFIIGWDATVVNRVLDDCCWKKKKKQIVKWYTYFRNNDLLMLEFCYSLSQAIDFVLATPRVKFWFWDYCFEDWNCGDSSTGGVTWEFHKELRRHECWFMS